MKELLLRKNDLQSEILVVCITSMMSRAMMNHFVSRRPFTEYFHQHFYAYISCSWAHVRRTMQVISKRAMHIFMEWSWAEWFIHMIISQQKKAKQVSKWREKEVNSLVVAFLLCLIMQRAKFFINYEQLWARASVSAEKDKGWGWENF